MSPGDTSPNLSLEEELLADIVQLGYHAEVEQGRARRGTQTFLYEPEVEGPPKPATLERFVKHAGVYGPAGVFSAALTVLLRTELLALFARLETMGWRPSPAERAAERAAKLALAAPQPPIREFHAHE